MKPRIVGVLILVLAVLIGGPASAAGIMVTQAGLSDPALSVPVGEPVSWIDATGNAVRIAFPDVQGAPVLKEFIGREVHVVLDRPGRYRYTVTVATPGGTRELGGEITIR